MDVSLSLVGLVLFVASQHSKCFSLDSMSKINKKSLYSWGLSLALFHPLTLGNWTTSKMCLEVFPSDFIICVPTQPPHADTCWWLFILSWWQIVLWMSSQLTCFSFRDWRHTFSPVEMQVHTNRTLLSPFLFASLGLSSTFTFFLCHYFSQPGLQISPSWACSPWWSWLWSLEGAYVFLCSVLLWDITHHTHPSWSMCAGGTGLPPALGVGAWTRPGQSSFCMTPTIVIAPGWAHDWWAQILQEVLCY